MADYTIYQKTTPTFTFTITDEDGNAFDLTDATIYFKAKTDIEATSYVFEKTCTISDAVNGICYATLTQTDTATAQTIIAEVNLVKNAMYYVAKQFTIEVKASFVS